MQTENTQQPLYKVLNNQMICGYTISNDELRTFVPEGWSFFRARDYGGDQVGIKYRKPYAEGETHWNEDGFEYKEIFVSSKKIAYDKYAALAINNLHLLAEALENFIGCFDNPAMRMRQNEMQAETIKFAKETLSKIS